MKSPFELAQVENWIREAGDIALRYYQTELIQERKEDSSPVTEADRAVEQFLIGKFESLCAELGHGLIAEESGGEWHGHEFVWTIDPIDGTRVFANGLPTWSITIGLLFNGEPYRGLVYLPTLNELYYTDDAGLAFWNGRPLAGKLRTDWDQDSFIAVSSTAHRQFDIDFRRVRALGAVATNYVYVARGAAVAALQRQVNVWDIAGAYAILAAVGGIAVSLAGRQLSFAEVLAEGENKGPVLIGHPRLVEQLLPKIKVR